MRVERHERGLLSTLKLFPTFIIENQLEDEIQLDQTCIKPQQAHCYYSRPEDNLQVQSIAYGNFRQDKAFFVYKHKASGFKSHAAPGEVKTSWSICKRFLMTRASQGSADERQQLYVQVFRPYMPRADAPDDFYYKAVLCPYSVVRNFTKYQIQISVDGSNGCRENVAVSPNESTAGPLLESQCGIALSAFRQDEKRVKQLKFSQSYKFQSQTMRQVLDFSQSSRHQFVVVIERTANSPVISISVLPKIIVRNRVPQRFSVRFQKTCKYQSEPTGDDAIEKFSQRAFYSTEKYMYVVVDDGRASPAIPYVYDKLMQFHFCGSVIAVKVVRSQGLDIVDVFTCQYQQYLVQNQTASAITVRQLVSAFDQSSLAGPADLVEYRVEPGICLNYILDDLLQEHPTILVSCGDASAEVRLDFEKEGVVPLGSASVSCTRRAGRVFISVEEAVSAESQTEAVSEPLQKSPALRCKVETAALEVGRLGDPAAAKQIAAEAHGVDIALSTAEHHIQFKMGALSVSQYLSDPVTAGCIVESGSAGSDVDLRFDGPTLEGKVRLAPLQLVLDQELVEFVGKLLDSAPRVEQRFVLGVRRMHYGHQPLCAPGDFVLRLRDVTIEPIALSLTSTVQSSLLSNEALRTALEVVPTVDNAQIKLARKQFVQCGLSDLKGWAIEAATKNLSSLVKSVLLKSPSATPKAGQSTLSGFGDRSALRSSEKKSEAHTRQSSVSSASSRPEKSEKGEKSEKSEKAEKKPAGDVKKKWAAIKGKK